MKVHCRRKSQSVPLYTLSNDPHSRPLRPTVLVVDLWVVAGAGVLLVLPRKSHRLSAEQEGIKRDALLTAQAEPSQELSP